MWHKAPCSSRDYSGVRVSGPRKRDEDGDDDGDVDEDDHHGGDSPPDGVGTSPRQSSCDGDLHQHLHHLPQHIHHLPPSIFSTLPQPDVLST